MKYPYMFQTSNLCIINKTDLLPYVDFSMDKARQHASKLNADIKIFPVSCRTREGLEGWYAWLRAARAAKK